ncbi:hypothetical protein [Mycobacterium sp. 1245805.9]|nr:hypothetical protein [Mycobacterium sp. 1245805.9]
MDGEYENPCPDNSSRRTESLDPDDGHKAITSRDIDVLVQLKALRKRR